MDISAFDVIRGFQGRTPMFLLMMIFFRVTSQKITVQPRQILDKDVLQYVGILVSCKSNSFRAQGFRVFPETGIVVESHLCRRGVISGSYRVHGLFRSGVKSLSFTNESIKCYHYCSFRLAF